MEIILISLIILLAVILIGGFAYTSKLLTKTSLEKSQEQTLNQRLDSLGQHVTANLNEVTKNVLYQLNDVTKHLNERLRENTESQERSHRTIGERLDNAAKSYAVVTSKLSQLEEANKKIYDVGKDIANLQSILRTPKLRGTLGELFLGDLLAQVFTKDHYELQYGFKNGQKVDAVLRLREGYLVPIDAKFPLENFKKLIEASGEEQKKTLKKTFLTDVKKHINDIADKYIVPDEGTIDFALMYIPAENVYYEIMVKDTEDQADLLQYSFNKKVIPVSPNTFYIYLQSILLGIKGWKIQEQAKEMWQNLGRLRQDFGKFSEQFDLVGKHLTHARNSYDLSDRYRERFSDKLSTVADGQENQKTIEDINQAKLLDVN